MRFTEVHTGSQFPGTDSRAGALSTRENEIPATGGITGKTLGGLPNKDVGGGRRPFLLGPSPSPGCRPFTLQHF